MPHPDKTPDTSYVDNTRMIHLQEFARMEGRYSSDNASLSLGKEKHFNMLGHYDLMTYVKADKKKPTFEHQFLIRYPYSENPRGAVISEQFFTLFEFPGDTSDANSDPFDYEKRTVSDPTLPFLGVLLVSVEIPMGRDGKLVDKSYNTLLQELSEQIMGNNYSAIRQKIAEIQMDEKARIRLFKTHNCSNLVLVVRTRELNDIYIARERLVSQKITLLIDGKIEQFSPNMIITPLIACEMPECKGGKIYNPLTEAGVMQTGKNSMHFNIRFGFKKPLLLNDIKSTGIENVYNILGSGDSSVTLTYNNYAKLFPYIWFQKYHAMERDVYLPLLEEIQYAADDKTPAKMIADAIKKNEIRSIYERLRFDASITGHTSDLANNNFKLKVRSKDINRYLELRRHKVHSYVNLMGKCQQEYETNMSLLKDLMFSFFRLNDQNRHAIHGRIFTLQMKILFDDIDLAVGSNALSLKEIPYDQAKYLCTNLKSAILSINNYNKMLQILNQQMINNQGYEIQTRVNAEKYLLAYSCFLQEIFKNYKDYSKYIAVPDIYPIVAMDTTRSRIETSTLFSGIENASSSNDYSRFFTVGFPDYRNFADIYHVLPILTHELSHALRYTKREERNRNVIEFVMSFIAPQMVDYLLNVAHDTQIRYLNLFCDPLEKSIQEFLAEKIESQYAEKLKELRLKELKNELSKWMGNLLLVDGEIASNNSPHKVTTDLLDNPFVYWDNWMPVLREQIRSLYAFMGCRYISYDLLSNPDTADLNRLYITLRKNEPSDDSKDLDRALFLEVCYNIICILFLSDEEKTKDDLLKELKLYSEWTDLYIRYLNSHPSFEKEENPMLFTYHWGKAMVSNLSSLMKCEQKILQFAPNRLSYEKLLRQLGQHRYEKLDDMMRSCINSLVIGSVMHIWSRENLSEELLLNEPTNDFDVSMFSSRKSMELKLQWLAREHWNNGDNNNREIDENTMVELIGIAERFAIIQKITYLDKNYDAAINHGNIIGDLHHRLHNKVANIYSSKNTFDYLVLASRKNHFDFSRLGLNLESPEVFTRKFREMAEKHSLQLLQVIEDSVRLYEEIYADLGMCAAFNFTPFGYLRLALHVHQLQGGKNKYEHGAIDDRVLMVITIIMLCQEKETYENIIANRISEIEELESHLSPSAKKGSWKNLKPQTGNTKISRRKIITQSKDRLQREKEALEKDNKYLNEFVDSLSTAATGLPKPVSQKLLLDIINRKQTKLFQDSIDYLNSFVKDIKEWAETRSPKTGFAIEDIQTAAELGYEDWSKEVQNFATAEYSDLTKYEDIQKDLTTIENILKKMMHKITEYKEKYQKTKSPISLAQCDYFLGRISLLKKLFQIIEVHSNQYALPNAGEVVLPPYLCEIINVYCHKIYSNSWTGEYRENSRVFSAIKEHYNSTRMDISFTPGKEEVRKDGLYHQEEFISEYYGKCRDIYGIINFTSGDPITDNDAIRNELDSWLQAIINMDGLDRKENK